MPSRQPRLSNLESLAEFLAVHKVPALPNDGVVYRFKRSNDKDNGYYQGTERRGRLSVLVGEWGTDLYELFRADMAGVSDEERTALDADWQAAQFALRAAKLTRQAEAAKEAQAIWEDALDVGSTPYTVKKKIKLAPARIDSDDPTTLLVPLYNEFGEVVNLQRIFANGEKRYLTGALKRGTSCQFGREGSPVYLCEGFATASSVYEAIGPDACVIACMDTGGLEQVRARLPGPVTFCADNDAFTEGVTSRHHRRKGSGKRR